MYVIRSGEIEIERDGKVVETLLPGGIFGEMALIDGSSRAATARAKTSCEVAPITEKSFLFLVHETPFFAIAVMRTLAERLRRSGPNGRRGSRPSDLWLAIAAGPSHDRADSSACFPRKALVVA
jgi:CRP-like cAMP-binding protein